MNFTSSPSCAFCECCHPLFQHCFGLRVVAVYTAVILHFWGPALLQPSSLHHSHITDKMAFDHIRNFLRENALKFVAQEGERILKGYTYSICTSFCFTSMGCRPKQSNFRKTIKITQSFHTARAGYLNCRSRICHKSQPEMSNSTDWPHFRRADSKSYLL